MVQGVNPTECCVPGLSSTVLTLLSLWDSALSKVVLDIVFYLLYIEYSIISNILTSVQGLKGVKYLLWPLVG